VDLKLLKLLKTESIELPIMSCVLSITSFEHTDAEKGQYLFSWWLYHLQNISREFYRIRIECSLYS